VGRPTMRQYGRKVGSAALHGGHLRLMLAPPVPRALWWRRSRVSQRDVKKSKFADIDPFTATPVSVSRAGCSRQAAGRLHRRCRSGWTPCATPNPPPARHRLGSPGWERAASHLKTPAARSAGSLSFLRGPCRWDKIRGRQT
jgi:hypothetical protein